ncbi:MAG: hypothetical protein NXI04_02885 [Planctomycetaceae bacterium]|nr:hypothetical protein [Planctomycetaceae bacterium]
MLRRLIFLTLITVPAAGSAQLSVEAVSRALDIAEQSAAHGQADVSIRAVVGSLRFGPPTRVEFPSSEPIRHWGARVDTSRPVPPGPAEALTRRVPVVVRRLEPLWAQHAGSASAWQAVRDVVFPREQMFRSFPYAGRAQVSPLRPDRFQPVDSLLTLLVDSAARADALPALAADILSRRADQSAETYAAALLVALRLSAVGEQHTDLVRRLQSLLSLDRMTLSPGQCELLASVASEYYRERSDLAVAASVLAGITNSLERTPHDDRVAGAMMLLAARCQLATDRTDEAVQSLGVYLGEEATSKAGRQARMRRADVVSRELFSRGLVKEAARLLPADTVEVLTRRYDLRESDDRPRPAVPLVPRATLERLPDGRPAAEQICLCRLDLATQSSQALFALPDFVHVASPAVSPDGRFLAFDACFPGEPITSAGRIYLLDLQQGQMRHLVNGTLPSWSPGGGRLTYSAVSPSRGVWIIRSSGDEARLLDPLGWSARWSPDGRMIAWARSEISGSRQWGLAVYDLVEDEYFDARGLSPQRQPIRPGFEWMPDGLALLVGLDGGDGRVSLQQVGVLQEQRHPLGEAPYFADDLAITNRLVFGVMKKFASSPEQIYQSESSGQWLWRPVAGQFSQRRNTGVTRSADGQTLYYVSKPPRK